jgi:hypothetical protein
MTIRVAALGLLVAVLQVFAQLPAPGTLNCQRFVPRSLGSKNCPCGAGNGFIIIKVRSDAMSQDAEQRTEIERAVDAALDARIGEFPDLYSRVLLYRLKHVQGFKPGETSPTPAQVAIATDIEPLVRVVARAVEVLGTSEKAFRWIKTPVPSLGNRTPLSLLDSPEGMVSVEDALGRIEHGVW